MQPVYGVLIVFLCFQLQSALGGVSSHSPKAKKPGKGAAQGPEEELVGTIRQPFSETDFELPIQSPVDIITSKLEEKSLPPLSIHEPVLPGVMADIFNTGETATIFINEYEHDKLPYLNGGPLKEKFIFEQMHFHWGKNDEWGSEHMVDGEAFSVEIHMVHFNSKYEDFHSSLSKNDGLAVLTVFAEVEKDKNENNKLLEPLHKLLSSDLRTPNVHKALPWHDAMKWAISGLKVNTEYYTYPGSLTTPKYNQNVAFIVLPIPITISHDQLAAFRKLYHNAKKEAIVENKRNIHPLNRRPLFKGVVNLQEEKDTGSTSTA